MKTIRASRFGVTLLLATFRLTLALAHADTLTNQFPVHLRTTYFDCYFRRETSRSAETARFADGFIDVVNRDFFKVTFDYPIRMLVLEDQPRFKEYLKKECRISDPPDYGIYFPEQKTFITYEGSGLGTFAHEIMHPLVERNLPDYPAWAREGIPTFFEKFYGYWDGQKLELQWGFQNPWRIEALSTNLIRLDLAQIVSYSPGADNYAHLKTMESQQRLVSMFLWQQHQFTHFLHTIAARDKQGYPTYLEAAMGMPIDRIIPLWQKYLADLDAKRVTFRSFPASSVFDDRATLKTFTTIYHIPTETNSPSTKR